MNSQDLSSFIYTLKKVLELEPTHQEGSKRIVLTVKEVADELQVSIPTLRDHFLCRPDFPKIRAGTKILIPRKAFEQWVNGQS